jgi:penicillin-binding protein 1A
MDQNTKVLEKRDVKLEQVLSPSLAYTMNQLLKGVMDRGTGASARRGGFNRPAAGKTGTTNDYKDAWFVGYTPELLAVVWVGYDGPAKIGLSGSEAALPIWTEFMKTATANMPVTDFVPPPALRSETPEEAPTEKCGSSTREGEPPGGPCPAPTKPAEPA